MTERFNELKSRAAEVIKKHPNIYSSEAQREIGKIVDEVFEAGEDFSVWYSAFSQAIRESLSSDQETTD